MAELREEWWITTDFLFRGGKLKLGPFESNELALKVRTFVEKAEGQEGRYFVDAFIGPPGVSGGEEK